MKRTTPVLSALLLSTALATPAMADELSVVSSFSIIADMARVVGGEHVTVTSLVGANEDAHVYEPVPTDVVSVAEADVVLVNGLGFEGFMDRLIEASETEATVATVSNGISVIETGDDHDDHDDHGDHDDHDDHAHDEHDHDHDHDHDHAHDDHDHDHAHDDHDHDDEHAHDDHAHDDHDHDHDHDDHAHDDHDHGDEHAHDDHGHDEHEHDDHAGHDHDGHDHGPEDPHAWQSLDAAQVYVANIADAFCDTAPDHCEAFETNARVYAAELEALEGELAALLAPIAEEDRIVITSHDALAYMARDFDMTILAPQGISTESEASAADVARIIDLINDTGARAMFVDVVGDSRLLEQIASETSLTVSDTVLYTDALSDGDGPAATYVDMMRHNVTAIAQALQGS